MKVKTHFAGIGLCAVLTTALTLSASAADTGLYFNADAGATWEHNGDLDVGFRFSAGVGYNLNPNWGVEFDTGWVWNQLKDSGDSSLAQLPFMVDLVYRYPIGAKWEAYIGGGAGGVYSTLTIDEQGFDDDDGDVVFGWQAFAGVRYKISETMSVGIGYKYLGVSGADFSLQSGGNSRDESSDTLHYHTAAAVFNWKF